MICVRVEGGRLAEDPIITPVSDTATVPPGQCDCVWEKEGQVPLPDEMTKLAASPYTLFVTRQSACDTIYFCL